MAENLLAADSSVAVPLVLANHPDLEIIAAWARDKPKLYLSGHALAETYSIITRLRVPFRVSAEVARSVIDASFAGTIYPKASTLRKLHRIFAEVGISEGAVYDGLVALAALDNGATLVTRDIRASATYDALGVTTEIIP